jgi:hypothetical protein
MTLLGLRLKWKLILVCFGMVLILTQDRCTVCAEITIGLEIVLDAPDATPMWRGSCGILFWSILRLCKCRCKIGAPFVLNIAKPQKSFWTHSMVLLGYEAQFDARFNPCEIVLIMMQDRCMVCVERTTCSEIILDTTDGTPRWRGSCEISFRCKIGARFAPIAP